MVSKIKYQVQLATVIQALPLYKYVKLTEKLGIKFFQ